jgi:hypothetical protein
MSRPAVTDGWEDALLPGALALLASIAGGLVFFGWGALRPSSAGFQVLATGAAGAAGAVALRRSGRTWAVVAALLVLLAIHLAVGSGGYRTGWPAILWLAVIAVSILAGFLVFDGMRRVTHFGRFVFVSLLMGAGFAGASALVAVLMGLPQLSASLRINFAVGSLAGAGIGLGLEVAELLFRRGVARR